MKKIIISVMDTFVAIIAIILITSCILMGMGYPALGGLLGAFVGGVVGTLISGLFFGFWVLLSNMNDQLTIIANKRVDKPNQ
jgi:hypothetical protein